LKTIKVIAPALLGVVGVSAVLLRTWPLINVVETGRTPEYPDIAPRQYRASATDVFDAALHAVTRMPRWSLVRYSEDRGDIQVEARTLVLRFVDDIVIRIADHEPITTVNVRSASRIGRGDFGQNARNIRGFLKELDQQMQQRVSH
jgi:uncharacterized protein (DUF1499 family)